MNRELDPERHVVLVRYLLDELDDEERDRLEESLLADRDAQEDLAVAEEEITDLYAKGELLPEQRRLLERKFFGSPEWKTRIDLARAMNRAEAELAEEHIAPLNGLRKWLAKFRGRGFRVPLAVLASILLILGVWIALPPGQRDKDSSAALPRFTPTVRSFLLAPTVRKGPTSQSDNLVLLPGETGLIELRLPLDRDFYSNYRVELQSLETRQTVSLGTETPFRERGAKAELRVSVNSAQLHPGTYTIILQSSEANGSVTDVAGYSFQVKAK